MKKFILSLILCLIGLISIAQVRYESTHLAIALPDTTNTDSLIWGNWDEVKVIISISEKKVTIYSNFEQEYIGISGKVKVITDEIESVEFEAIDLFDEKVSIELVHWKKENKDQIYITWKDLALCYQMKKL